MKQKAIFIGIVILIGLIFTNCTRQSDFPVLKGPYLGQKPPGMTTEIFAPCIISSRYHDGCITFSPNQRELFYHFGGTAHLVILQMKQEYGRWTAPQIASFSGRYRDGEPHISYDGKRLVFRSNRPLDEKGEPMEYTDIWMTEKNENGWSAPRNLGLIVNSEKDDLYPTISTSGDLYFASNRDGGWDIYVSRFINHRFTEPEKLSEAINSEYGAWDACVAPDNNYIIFCSTGRQDGLGRSDLYISFKKDDDTWTKSINIGNRVNSSYNEVDPVISPDGKYIFFRSNRIIRKPNLETSLTYYELLKKLNAPGNGDEDIYWVDAKIIEDLKPDELK